jgi:hypothetical protein
MGPQFYAAVALFQGKYRTEHIAKVAAEFQSRPRRVGEEENSYRRRKSNSRLRSTGAK